MTYTVYTATFLYMCKKKSTQMNIQYNKMGYAMSYRKKRRKWNDNRYIMALQWRRKLVGLVSEATCSGKAFQLVIERHKGEY